MAALATQHWLRKKAPPKTRSLGIPGLCHGYPNWTAWGSQTGWRGSPMCTAIGRGAATHHLHERVTWLGGFIPGIEKRTFAALRLVTGSLVAAFYVW